MVAQFFASCFFVISVVASFLLELGPALSFAATRILDLNPPRKIAGRGLASPHWARHFGRSQAGRTHRARLSVVTFSKQFYDSMSGSPSAFHKNRRDFRGRCQARIFCRPRTPVPSRISDRKTSDCGFGLVVKFRAAANGNGRDQLFSVRRSGEQARARAHTSSAIGPTLAQGGPFSRRGLLFP